MKRSEAGIALIHEVMTSFSLLKWPWHTKSGANLANVTIWGCNHMYLRMRTNA